MKIILCYNDEPRFFTVGSYIKKELANQDDIEILSHCRIPEDTGICEESCNPDTDLILVIDSGIHFKLHHHKGKLPKNCKTAIWLSDLHRPDWASWRLQMIKEFHYDHVFYAQKNFKQMILDKGYEEHECSWLPHAVDPEIFKPMPHISKRYDIGFVGYLNEKREKMFNTLDEYMDSKHYSSAWAWTASRCLNELKIGWNCAVESDINMRIFETLSTGIPLLTDKVKDNGLEDLFQEDVHFLTYDSEEELKEKAVRLLADSNLRKVLGENGRQHILMHHTYRNRVNTILGTFNFPLLENY